METFAVKLLIKKWSAECGCRRSIRRVIALPMTDRLQSQTKKTKQITHVKSLMFPSSHSLEFKSIFVNSLKCLFLTSFAYWICIRISRQHQQSMAFLVNNRFRDGWQQGLGIFHWNRTLEGHRMAIDTCGTVASHLHTRQWRKRYIVMATVDP